MIFKLVRVGGPLLREAAYMQMGADNRGSHSDANHRGQIATDHQHAKGNC